LPVRAQPIAERARVQRRIFRIQAAESPRRARRGQALPCGEHSVPRQRAREVKRGREPRAPEPRDSAARLEDRDVEAILENDVRGHAEAGEQRAVRGETAEEDMLAVVHPEAVSFDRERRSAQPAAGL
jgi:hypothetical protein